MKKIYMSKNVLKKILNKNFNFKDIPSVQIIKFEDFNEKSLVTLWDGTTETSCIAINNVYQEIKNGVLSNWSIIEISSFKLIHQKNSLGRNYHKQDPLILLEQIRLVLDGDQVKKKLVDKTIKRKRINTEESFFNKNYNIIFINEEDKQVTVSEERIDENYMSLTNFSELETDRQYDKIFVKVENIYSSDTSENLLFDVEGKEKKTLIRCDVNPRYATKNQNKIKCGTLLEINNAAVQNVYKIEDSSCDNNLELVVNQFLTTEFKILSLIDRVKPSVQKNQLEVVPMSAEISSVRKTPGGVEFIPAKMPPAQETPMEVEHRPAEVPLALKPSQYTTFMELATKKFAINGHINVIAKVTCCGKCQTKVIANKTQKIRQIKLADESNNLLRASLWNKHAENFTATEGSIIQILNTRVRCFQKVNELNVTDIAKIIVGSISHELPYF